MNLLIVDDEALIREEIKSKIIRLSLPGINHIGLAADGSEAKQLIQTLDPGIILTDIQMPVMDGLSLIRDCSQSNPTIQFIVLSGHDDYGFVREAFKYGIVDYLLKPVRITELEQLLNQAVQQYQNALFRLNPQVNTIDGIRQFFLQYLHKEDTTHTLAALPIAISDSFSQNNWQICQFIYAGPAKHFPSLNELEQNLNHAFNQKDSITIIVLKHNSEGGTFLINLNRNFENHTLIESIKIIINNYSTVYNVRITAALSDSISSFDKLNEAYIQTSNILTYRILHEEPTVLTSKDTNDKIIQLPLSSQQIEKLMDSIRTLQLKNACEIINICFEKERLKVVDIASIRQIYMIILTEIYRWHNDKLPSDQIHLNDDFNLHHSLLSIRSYLTNLLNIAIQQTREAGMHSLIGIVKQYIEDRPLGDVTLAEVSNLVSMNYSYFSTWFKEEMGFTFSAYMMKLKMEQAKRFLEDPLIRINEVALKVGYDSVYHFSRAFKNHVGLSPKEYRKQVEEI